MRYQRYVPALFLPLAFSTGVPYTAYTQFVAKAGELDPLSTGKSCPDIRVRKEWRALTDGERQEWLGSIRCLGGMPAPPGYQTAQDVQEGIDVSLYDAFSWVHSKLNGVVHGNAHFLPWHRWFVMTYESNLRDRCGYTGPLPYWDWTIDAPSPINSPIFDTDPTRGLGGSGSPSQNHILTTGALAGFPLRYPVPHVLRRHLSLRPFLDEDPEEKRLNGTFSSARVERLFARTSGAHEPASGGGDFHAFQKGMASMHNAVHNFLGGDAMGQCPPPILEADCDRDTPGLSPNEPMFWLHHAQVDRLWNMWQHQHPSNLQAFTNTPRANSTSRKVTSAPALTNTSSLSTSTAPLTNSTIPLNITRESWLRYYRLSPEIQIAQVMEVGKWPLCYEYLD